MKSPSKVRAVQSSLVVIGVGLAFYALASRCLGNPDLGWHLATGRSIVAHGAIPRIDDLAVSHAPVRYVLAISDVLLYLAMRVGGDGGVQVFGALVALTTPLLTVIQGRKTPAALMVAALLAAALNAWVSPSSSPCSLPLLAATLLLLDLHRRAPDSRGGRRALFGLVPLLFVWANTHGTVTVGAIIVLTYAFDRLVALHKRALPTLLVCIAAVLAATLNPAGPRVLLATRRFDETLHGITEWEAPSLDFLIHDQPFVLVIGALGLVALAFGREPDDEGGGRKPRLFDVLAVLGSLAGVPQANRMIPLAAIVIAPVVARRLGGFVPRTTTMGLAASAATIASAAYLFLNPTTTRGVGFDPIIFPIDATSFVERANPAGRMWNFWPFGGYLAWRLGPTREVLTDGRNTLAHPRALVERAGASVTDPNAFESLVDEYDLQWAITRASAAEPTFGRGVARSARFTMVYLDDGAAVYMRSDGPNAGLAREGYRVLRHDTPPFVMLDIATGQDEKAKNALAHDGDLAHAQAPESTRSTFVFACGAIAAQDDKKLRAAVETLTRLGAAPSLIEALTLAASRTPPSSRQP